MGEGRSGDKMAGYVVQTENFSFFLQSKKQR